MTQDSQSNAQSRISRDRLLRAKDVARLLNVSQRSVWRLRNDGFLPEPVRISKTLVRWRQSDIDKLIAQRIADPLHQSNSHAADQAQSSDRNTEAKRRREDSRAEVDAQ